MAYLGGADKVVAALNDYGGDVPDLGNLHEQVALRKEAPVDKVVALDASERFGEAIAAELPHELLRGRELVPARGKGGRRGHRVFEQLARAALPRGPGDAGGAADLRVVARQTLVVGSDLKTRSSKKGVRDYGITFLYQVPSLLWRNHRKIGLPRVRKEPRRALLRRTLSGGYSVKATPTLV